MTVQQFTLDKKTPKHLRVFMTEGHRLTDEPDPQQLWRACTIGSRIGHSRNKPRVKCKSRIGAGGKRWTTAEAWDFYLDQINGEA